MEHHLPMSHPDMEPRLLHMASPNHLLLPIIQLRSSIKVHWSSTCHKTTQVDHLAASADMRLTTSQERNSAALHGPGASVFSWQWEHTDYASFPSVQTAAKTQNWCASSVRPWNRTSQPTVADLHWLISTIFSVNDSCINNKDQNVFKLLQFLHIFKKWSMNALITCVIFKEFFINWNNYKTYFKNHPKNGR